MVKRMTTKDLIADSLAELGAARPFDKITVQDIAENCSISKGTFYYHFSDKYELAAWMYQRDTRAMFDKAMLRGSYRDFQLDCVLAALERRQLYLNIIENTRGLDSMMLAIQRETFDLLSRYLNVNENVDELDRKVRFSINYYTHATANMIVDWVRDDRGLSPGDFTDWLLECMPPMLKEAIGGID